MHFLPVIFLEKIQNTVKREEVISRIKNIEMPNFILFQYMLYPGNKIYSMNQVFWLYQEGAT